MVCFTRPVLPWHGGHLKLHTVWASWCQTGGCLGLFLAPGLSEDHCVRVICLGLTPSLGPKDPGGVFLVSSSFPALEIHQGLDNQMAGCLRLAPCMGTLTLGWTGRQLRLAFFQGPLDSYYRCSQVRTPIIDRISLRSATS